MNFHFYDEHQQVRQDDKKHNKSINILKEKTRVINKKKPFKVKNTIVQIQIKLEDIFQNIGLKSGEGKYEKIR